MNGEYVDTNERDEEGNNIGWGIINEIDKVTESNEISMNWGWEEITNIINEDSDDFFANLRNMAIKNLTKNEEEIAMLSRMGLSTSEMAILIGRSDQAISSRKETLRTKLFGDKKHSLNLNNVILLIS